MGSHRLGRAAQVALLLLASAAGCQTLHPPTPIDVQVRDAETQAPIGGAHVSIWHNSMSAAASSGVTGPDGQAHVPTPPPDDTPILYEASAKGCLNRQTDHPAERTASGVVLEVYAEPRPVLELVVPNGYRGTIRATISVRNDAPFPLHQRLFSVAVPATGVVEAVIPPIFTRGSTPDIRTRYADGAPLSRTAKDYEVGCRWLISDPDSMYLFVIGTQWEADQIRRSLKSHAGEGLSIGRAP